MAARQFIAYSILAGNGAPRNGAPRMNLTSFFASIAAWLAAVTGVGMAQDVRRVVTEDEVILRIPVQPLRSTPMISWSEHKGPKCIDARLLAGARLSSESSVDFVLIDHSRVRAKLDSGCPALDFYGGFYLQTSDERICAKREEIRSRMGGSCRIEKFRTLFPELKR